jgi:dCMP deaminase
MAGSDANRRAFLDRFTEIMKLMSWEASEREQGRSHVRDKTQEFVGDPDWDDYFHAIAQVVALKSKDRNRQVGAVIVGEGRAILSTGFNGLPRGVREVPERMTPKDEKYRWITHAETNAIFNAARTGVSLAGSTLYVTTFPCGPCAQAIVQCGIKAIFTYGTYWSNDPNGYEKATDVLAEAGVTINAPLVRNKDAQFWRQDQAKATKLGGAVPANDQTVSPKGLAKVNGRKSRGSQKRGRAAG